MVNPASNYVVSVVNAVRTTEDVDSCWSAQVRKAALKYYELSQLASEPGLGLKLHVKPLFDLLE